MIKKSVLGYKKTRDLLIHMTEELINKFVEVDDKIYSNSSQEFLELFLTVTDSYKDLSLTPKNINEILSTLEESIRAECDIAKDCHKDDISTFVNEFAEEVLYAIQNKNNNIKCINKYLKSQI